MTDEYPVYAKLSLQKALQLGGDYFDWDDYDYCEEDEPEEDENFDRKFKGLRPLHLYVAPVSVGV